MRIVQARNVNDAYAQGLVLLASEGREQDSRAGPVLAMDCPVTTVYERPQERVLLDPHRDANPFFHLFEALWMLAGRRDATWLDQFVSDFSSRFAEDDGEQHGAYGHRWRRHFDMEGGGVPGLPDQLDTVVELLRRNPDDRRVVLTMWDPVADLYAARRDVPCNTHVYPRIVSGRLDLTVCCRSNDAVWGAYGANAVQFSVLQEYLAGRIGVEVGTYYQVSNNYHVYRAILDRLRLPYPRRPVPYIGSRSMGDDWSSWDRDLVAFMEWTEEDEPDQCPQDYPANPWFKETAEPLFVAHHFWRHNSRLEAYDILRDERSAGVSPDWRTAAQEWMERRLERAGRRE